MAKNENLSADVTTGEIGRAVVRASQTEISDAVARVNALGDANALGIFSSIDGSTFEGKVATLNAITDSKPIADNIGVQFSLKDVVVQAITLTQEVDGALTEVPAYRVILVTDQGAFHAVSNGLFRSVQNVFATLGHPSTWPSTIKATVAQEGQGMRKFFTLKVLL